MKKSGERAAGGAAGGSGVVVDGAGRKSIYLVRRVGYTKAPLRGRLTPPAALEQGRVQQKNVKGAERGGP